MSASGKSVVVGLYRIVSEIGKTVKQIPELFDALLCLIEQHAFIKRRKGGRYAPRGEVLHTTYDTGSHHSVGGYLRERDFRGHRFLSPGESDDRTLSPYFYVKSEDAGVDALPLKATSARVNISGVIANVQVSQVYSNQGKKALEKRSMSALRPPGQPCTRCG